jgi:hypothetical protein
MRPAGYARRRFDIVLGDVGIDGTGRAFVVREIVLCRRGSGSEQEDGGCVATSNFAGSPSQLDEPESFTSRWRAFPMVHAGAERKMRAGKACFFSAVADEVGTLGAGLAIGWVCFDSALTRDAQPERAGYLVALRLCANARRSARTDFGEPRPCLGRQHERMSNLPTVRAERSA